MSLKKYNIKNNEKNIKTYIYFNSTKNNKLEDIQLLLDNENFNIYPNSYKNVTEYIYRIVNNSNFLCKGLNPEYILQSFDEVDAVVVIGSQMNILPNGNVFGFASIKFDEKHNSIYIDVICSHIGIKGAGDILIKTIEHISKTLLMTKIYLNSVESAISFYEKYDFVKEDKSCNDMCVMIKTLRQRKISNKKNNSKSKSKTSSTKKRRSTSAKKSTTAKRKNKQKPTIYAI